VEGLVKEDAEVSVVVEGAHELVFSLLSTRLDQEFALLILNFYTFKMAR
jgi:hypothetical protein